MKKTTLHTLIVSLGLTVASHGAIVAHWSFDTDFTADTGGAAFDLSAGNGAPTNTSGSAGKFGEAASFTRADSEFLTTTASPLPGSTSADFSYSAWFKTSFNATSERLFVLETTGNYTASIGLRDSGAGDYAQIYESNSLVGNTATGINDGIWHNIVVTYDGSAGLYTAYLDGASFATLNSSPAGAATGLNIGGHRNGTGRNFDGLIDDVVFTDHVLTTQEITNLQTMSATVAIVPEPSSTALLGLGALALILRRKK